MLGGYRSRSGRAAVITRTPEAAVCTIRIVDPGCSDQWRPSRGPFVQAPAERQVLHPAVGAWIEERDEALASRKVAVADRAQRHGRRFLQCVGVVEAHLPAHPECDALFVRENPKPQRERFVLADVRARVDPSVRGLLVELV